MINAGAGVIGSLIGGRLFDKLGAYRTILIGATTSASAAILLAFFFETYVLYGLFLACMGFGSGMMAPSMYALAGSLWQKEADGRLMRFMSRKMSVFPSERH